MGLVGELPQSPWTRMAELNENDEFGVQVSSPLSFAILPRVYRGEQPKKKSGKSKPRFYPQNSASFSPSFSQNSRFTVQPNKRTTGSNLRLAVLPTAAAAGARRPPTRRPPAAPGAAAARPRARRGAARPSWRPTSSRNTTVWGYLDINKHDQTV